MTEDHQNFEEAWWTVPQACIWIATRSVQEVAGADQRMRQSAFVASESFDDDRIWTARALIAAAASRGRIEVSGRYRGDGAQQPVPPIAWGNLEITDEGDQMAARPSGYDPFADWWDTLRVSADAVRAQWPPPQAEPSLDDAKPPATMTTAEHVASAQPPVMTLPLAAWLEPIILRIAADGLQLKRPQFTEMVRAHPLGANLSSTELSKLWGEGTPADWREVAQGRLSNHKKVDDWRRYVDAPNTKQTN